MGKFIEDFKAFALKGNVVDMAIGVIIGGAFGKIVTSLVNDIIMPVVSIVTGGDGYKNLKYVITPGQPAVGDVAAVEEVAINYGLFIQNVVDGWSVLLHHSALYIHRVALYRQVHEEGESRGRSGSRSGTDCRRKTSYRNTRHTEKREKVTMSGQDEKTPVRSGTGVFLFSNCFMRSDAK